jgi:predicted dehydrogenase
VSPLRAGIAGYGLAGEVFHAPLIDSVDGIDVAGIVTRNPERQAKARAAYPEARVVEDVDELWDGIDVLVIATPNRAHVPLGLRAVEHGVPVVVDKPLAPSLTDAELLLSTGGRITVFQNRRWDGDFLTLQGQFERGELGTVSRFESRFERFRPELDASAWREFGDAAEGGGLLLDLGAHLVDQARVLFGPPLSVYAELHKRRPGAQVEDDVFLALEHEGGVRAHLWMSAVAPLHGPRFRVSGLEGGFSTDGLDPQEAQLADGMQPGDPGYGEVEGLERGAYERFYEGVRDWLREDAPAPVDPHDSLACMRVLEAARRSADTNSVIELEGST